MTGALSPAGALALVAALTPGLQRAAVATRDGACLAGDPGLAADAHRVLRDTGAAQARGAKGLHVAGDDRHLVAAQAGPEVLGGLLLADLRSALSALRDG
jgi:hypothetical protein